MLVDFHIFISVSLRIDLLKLLSSHQASAMNKILKKLPEDDKFYCKFTAYFQNTSSKENIWIDV